MRRIVLVALALGAGLAFWRELPQLRRYVKMSRM